MAIGPIAIVALTAPVDLAVKRHLVDEADSLFQFIDPLAQFVILVAQLQCLTLQFERQLTGRNAVGFLNRLKGLFPNFCNFHPAILTPDCATDWPPLARRLDCNSTDNAMAGMLEIRESSQDDIAAIDALYPLAFPDEELRPLVRSLLDDSAVALSLVATIGSEIAGHVIFTDCGVEGSNIKASMLAPLAVAPSRQRQGIGTAIVGDGLQRLRDAGVSLVCVLGDPAYYGRLGFAPEAAVEPPYPLPAEWKDAWQSQYLGDDISPCAGQISVPKQWRQPALWAP